VSETTHQLEDLARLLKVIADETRLRILGALAAEPLTGKDLAERLNLTPATISHHMRKLVDAGIVSAQADAQRQWYRLNGDLLRSTRAVPIHAAASSTNSPDSSGEEAFRAKVIRDFFVGEQLKQIPSQRKRRLIVLQYLLERFEPTRTYTEHEVNDLLRPAHEDVATLRRELVDYGYLVRDRGIYQLTRGAPERGATVSQEVTGDERAWLRQLLAGVIGGNDSLPS
jgi:biotin operon repressor